MDGSSLLRTTRLLWLPFGLCLLFLVGNLLVIALFGGATGDAHYEEADLSSLVNGQSSPFRPPLQC